MVGIELPDRKCQLLHRSYISFRFFTNMGEGDYRVVVETKGNIIYNSTFEYTD